MSKNRPIFKTLDSFLFKQVDRFITSQSSQKINDLLAPLSEPVQKIVNHGVTLLLIILPILITLGMALSNYGLEKENQALKATIDTIDEVKSNKRQVNALASQVLSSGNLSSGEELKARFRDLNNKIDVISFDTSSAGNLAQAFSTLKFKEMTLQNMRSMLETVQIRERMKVNRLLIERDNKSKRLYGELELTHFSRTAATSEEDPT